MTKTCANILEARSKYGSLHIKINNIQLYRYINYIQSV